MENSKQTGVIIAAIIGLCGVVITALITGGGEDRAMARSISATETAEARNEVALVGAQATLNTLSTQTAAEINQQATFEAQAAEIARSTVDAFSTVSAIAAVNAQQTINAQANLNSEVTPVPQPSNTPIPPTETPISVSNVAAKGVRINSIEIEPKEVPAGGQVTVHINTNNTSNAGNVWVGLTIISLNDDSQFQDIPAKQQEYAAQEPKRVSFDVILASNLVVGEQSVVAAIWENCNGGCNNRIHHSRDDGVGTFKFQIR
ncbi:MAG: hypothetical protein AAF902_06020 [Chloroflexota bacterium]